jgi:hypothetical protein
LNEITADASNQVRTAFLFRSWFLVGLLRFVCHWFETHCLRSDLHCRWSHSRGHLQAFRLWMERAQDWLAFKRRSEDWYAFATFCCVCIVALIC